MVIPRKYARKRLCRLTGRQPTTVGSEKASEINRHDADQYRQDSPGASRECEIQCAFLTTQTEAATGYRPHGAISEERFSAATAARVGKPVVAAYLLTSGAGAYKRPGAYKDDPAWRNEEASQEWLAWERDFDYQLCVRQGRPLSKEHRNENLNES